MTEKSRSSRRSRKFMSGNVKVTKVGLSLFEVAVTPGEFMELDFTEPVLISQGWDDIDEDS